MFQFPAFASQGLYIQPGMRGYDSPRVSPFGHLRIKGCLRLPEAFRSLPRPSSLPGAKASTLRPLLLDFYFQRPTTAVSGFLVPGLWWNCPPKPAAFDRSPRDFVESLARSALSWPRPASQLKGPPRAKSAPLPTIACQRPTGAFQPLSSSLQLFG
jgi:hypothetical protein